ncbi:TrbI/VirB10 family protein [Stenotrophomonas oahuensis]|uniref:Type IV secretion system protein VirB10 n=1 Tax=Stenotrophomonas oahuensis TaxID=3003271 RepID=A0ABY9YXG9_9GAMM|nr:TrbI/VirB10 family protein [Stenotrophomonas sp. A5586]WNH54848.1 hypothetical protein PDM29_20760 [Stenotrophomonas sp. A5586]
MQNEIDEQDIPPLKSGGGMGGKLRIMALAMIVLVFLCIFGVVAWKWVKEKKAEEESQNVQPSGEVQSENKDTDLKAPPSFLADALANRAAAGSASGPGASEDAADPSVTADGGLAAPPGSPGTPSGHPGGSKQLTDAEAEAADHLARRQRAPVMAWSASGPSLANGMRDSAQDPKEESDPYQAMMAAALAQSGGGGATQAEQPSATLGQQLKSEARAPSVASRETNRSFMVRQATMGRCTMRTAFNSQLSGFASCILADPLYSADGRFIMAEAGSEAIGEYQTGQVKPGVSRAFVLWTSIETPHGVRIALDSPATDSMGRAGITGRVNNHFWKRFGSGLLLSVVDDGVTMAAGGDASDYRSTSQSMNDAASIAVQSNVDIPPTIKVKAGAVVNIFVARDLDFSSVYSLRVADSQQIR